MHLSRNCEKEHSYYSGIIGNISDTYICGDKYFNDGDLYTFPLSAFKNYDKLKFNEDFNSSIDNAIKLGLKNIVFSMNYKDGFRRSAGDDLTNFSNGKDLEKYDYSNFNVSSVPVIRLFFTDNLGGIHLSLRNLKNKNGKEFSLDDKDITNNRFFSEEVAKKYNSDMLGFISILKENTIQLLLEIKEIKESLEFIGNYHSSEKNYISLYDMRNNFKHHQMKKMVNIDDVKAIIIKKEDLSNEEKNKMSKDSTHLLLRPITNKLEECYTDIISVEIVMNNEEYHYMKDKESVNSYHFNKIIQESADIKIIKKESNENRLRNKAPFEYNEHRKLNIENSDVFLGIKKGYTYYIEAKDFKPYIYSKIILDKINRLEDLGISSFIMNMSTPHHFLKSNESFENNDIIYIERTRMLEMKLEKTIQW